MEKENITSLLVGLNNNADNYSVSLSKYAILKEKKDTHLVGGPMRDRVKKKYSPK